MAFLEIHDLHTNYYSPFGTVRAVDGVNLSIEKQEAIGIAGESGCGKSTMALSIMNTLPNMGKVVKGQILLDGEEILSKTKNEMEKIRWKKIAMVFQEAMNALDPLFSVGDQIAETIMVHDKCTQKESYQRAGNLLELTGIDSSRLGDYPHEFSGGMKQRIMLALALCCNPQLLILDEPTTALDVMVQAQILELVKKLQKELGLTLILVSHDLSTIAELCDKVGIMYAGKIVEYGNSQEFFKETNHPYSRGLIASFPTIAGKRKRIDPIPGTPPDLLNPPVGCRFAPRCSHATDLCTQQEPSMIELSSTHQSLCHYAKELQKT